MTQQQVKPGDRVMVAAVVHENAEYGIWLRVGEGVAMVQVFVKPYAVQPFPTPAQKLRDAAEVLKAGPKEVVSNHAAYPAAYLVRILTGLADNLEASSTPKSPTLREAAQEMVGALDSLIMAAKEVGGLPEYGQVIVARRAMENGRAALAREEGTTDA